MEQVTQILKKFELQEKAGRKAISVDTIHESSIQFDIGHLMAVDQNELSSTSGDLKKNPEQFLQNRARDLTQLLVNQLWSLERDPEQRDVVQLPEAEMQLPRNLEYVQRPASKWERFAKKKGIQKKKKDSLVWDEEEKKWKPRFGYRGINQKKNFEKQAKEQMETDQ